VAGNLSQVVGAANIVVGARIVSAAGPIGTLIGGVAGALTGWWAGRAVSEAAETLTRDDDSYYRAHYDASPDRPADRAYDDVRRAYYLGQIASHNPNYESSTFDDAETELRQGWEPYADKYGSWQSVRGYAEAGFTRGRSRLDESARRAKAEQEGRTRGEIDDSRP